MSSQRAESHGPVEIISHWHPNLTINMVDDHTAWVKGSVPPPLDQRKLAQRCTFPPDLLQLLLTFILRIGRDISFLLSSPRC